MILLRAPRDPMPLAQTALLLVVNAGWLWGWSLLVGAVFATGDGPRAGGAPLELPAVLALVVLAAVARRLLAARVSERAARRVVRLAAAAVGLAAFQALWWQDGAASDVAVTRSVAGAVLSVLCWWRGGALPWPRPTLTDAEAGFRTGARSLTLLFLAATVAPGFTSHPVPSLTGLGLVTLFAALISMPLARVMDLSAGESADGSAALRVSGHWTSILTVAVAALLLAAVAASRVLLSGILQWLLGLLVALAGPALSIVVWLFDLPGQLMGRLLSLLDGGAPTAPPEPLSPVLPGGVSGSMPPTQPFIPAGDQADWLNAGLALLIVLTVTLALMLLVSRTRAREDLLGGSGVDEERDFVLPALTARQWAARLRARLGRRLRRRGARELAPDTPGRQVRQVYRELLQAGARARRPRLADETPGEYRLAMEAAPPFDETRDELALITDLYVRVRYGEEAPPAPSVRAARSAARTLTAAARRYTTDSE